MVALNESFAPGKPALGSKNRVGNFFGGVAVRAGENRPATRNRIGEKRPTLTIIASGRPVWPSRDPIFERGGINLYAMIHNNPVNVLDLLGLTMSQEYDSEQAAATAALQQAWSAWQQLFQSDSSQLMVEFGGNIGKKCNEAGEDKWAYSGPVQGQVAGYFNPLNSAPLESGWDKVGWYHTHYTGINGTPPDDYIPFSTTSEAFPKEGDTGAYTLPGETAYVIEPSGNAWSYHEPAMPTTVSGAEEADTWFQNNFNIQRNPGPAVEYIGNITPQQSAE